MIKDPTTYLRLPPEVRRMARIAAAAAADKTLSEYVTDLIRRDAEASGLARLVAAEREDVTR